MIPSSTLKSIQWYVEKHIPVGGFLRAVFENNLFEAFGHADEQNRRAMFEIVKYIYNTVPTGCYGSPEKVQRWLNVYDPKLQDKKGTESRS